MSSLRFSATLSAYSVPVFQQTQGILPAISDAIWSDYVSPSGGYVNYASYKVTGINERTGRKQSKRIRARDEAAAIQCATAENVCAPYVVELLPNDPPTEAQLAYARDMGAVIPNGACSHDVSAIISRIYKDDEAAVDGSLAECAIKHGLLLSRYTGTKMILELVDYLSPQEQKRFRADLKTIRKAKKEQGGANIGTNRDQTPGNSKRKNPAFCMADIAAIIKKTYRLSSSLKKATDLPGNMVSALLKLTQIAPCQAVPISGKISSA